MSFPINRILGHNTIKHGMSLIDSKMGLLSIAVCCTLLIALIFSGHGDDNTHVIFKNEGIPDFKNASILGNPDASLLKDQENHFSKQSKSVLDSQNVLKAEVDALKGEIEKLKAGNTSVQSPNTQVYGPVQTDQKNDAISVTQNTQNQQQAGSVGVQYSPSPVNGISTHVDLDETSNVHSVLEQGRLGLALPTHSGKTNHTGSSTISFPVKSVGNVVFKKPGIILPSGSYVKGVIMTGVEAPEGKTYPVLLQLDFAYVIPNDKRLDLAGCFMIAKAQGDLSTERVQMQATKLSCVSRRGGHFEREVNGFVADDVDNSFSVMGQVNTKQDRVAATAFLANIVSGIAGAIKQAQTTAQVTPLGGSQSVVTGDQMKYIGASGASDAASQVTQWYLAQAKNLLPTINVGSGQAVWIVMQDQVDLPKDYFNQNSSSGGENHESIYSHFTRILD